MKKIEFLGAAEGEVTGSCYLVTTSDDNQVLVDFGMFQGLPEVEKHNFQPLNFSPAGLQAVFLTHAHLDHCGRLPLLVFGGFQGKIYMTPPTKAFVEIILQDSARIAEKEKTKNPLYTTEEVWKVMKMVETVEYDNPISVGSVTATFRDAGHILGSASIELLDNENKDVMVFSGDLGNTPQSIVRPTKYIEKADFVVMESTYGDSAHPHENASDIIQEEINTIEKNGGTLLIPSFAIERTQELLHIIHHLKKEGKVLPETTVYFDSPMGIDATTVYMDFKDYYNDEVKNHPDIPFNFDGLVITDEPKLSKKINHEPGPKVIIAGSGMMNGGRILSHALEYLAKPTTRILFVGYQAEETIGRAILQGAKSVMIEKTQIPVRAHIREIKVLSSHADQPRLLTWLEHIKGVKKVFLTHGELPQQEALAEKIKQRIGIQDIALPKLSEIYEL